MSAVSVRLDAADGESAGQRLGDRIELSPVPHADEQGKTSCVFLVHGVRHREGAGERISALHDGDFLSLGAQPDNPINPSAVQVVITGVGGEPLGWVPDVLLEYVHGLHKVDVTALRVNGPEVGPRLRLLVRLTGTAKPGWSSFEGPYWVTAE